MGVFGSENFACFIDDFVLAHGVAVETFDGADEATEVFVGEQLADLCEEGLAVHSGLLRPEGSPGGDRRSDGH